MFTQNLQITIEKQESWKEIVPFYFVNSTYTKVRMLPSVGRNEDGFPVAATDAFNLNLCCFLQRHSSTSFKLSCLSYINLQFLKSEKIELPNTDINRKLILKCCGVKNTNLLFYHESNGIIELRRSNSFKKDKTFSLEKICNSLGLASQYDQIKACIDIVYIPQLLQIALCLSSMIVLVDQDDIVTMIHNDTEQRNMEKFIGLKYDIERKLLLAEGRTSMKLFQLEDNNNTWNTIMNIENPYFNRNSRLFAWDPSECVIITTERISMEFENIHILCYGEGRGGSKVHELGLITNKNSLKLNYCLQKHALLYVDADFSGRLLLRCVWMTHLKQDQEGNNSDNIEETNVIEGEHLAYLPDFTKKVGQLRPRFVHNTLGFVHFEYKQ